MEQTTQQITEMLGAGEAHISNNPKEAPAHYAKLESLWTRLRPEMEEDMKAKQDKLAADTAKMDADREKRKAGMKAFSEIMERREAERKADDEKRKAEREAD
jgi:Skp family chaperone for outer membrane proteins